MTALPDSHGALQHTVMLTSPLPHQPVFTDDEQPLGAVDLCQPHFLIEGAVAPQHHGYAVGKAPFGHLGG